MKLVDLCVFLRPHHIAGQPSAVRTTTLESSKRNIAWEFGHLKKHVGTNLPLWNIKELRCDVGSSFSKKETSSKIYHIYYRKSTFELSIINNIQINNRGNILKEAIKVKKKGWNGPTPGLENYNLLFNFNGWRKIRCINNLISTLSRVWAQLSVCSFQI